MTMTNGIDKGTGTKSIGEEKGTKGIDMETRNKEARNITKNRIHIIIINNNNSNIIMIIMIPIGKQSPWIQRRCKH